MGWIEALIHEVVEVGARRDANRRWCARTSEDDAILARWGVRQPRLSLYTGLHDEWDRSASDALLHYVWEYKEKERAHPHLTVTRHVAAMIESTPADESP